MCGITALQLRDPRLYDRLGSLAHGMLCQIVERGPDSAGIALYDDPRLNPEGMTSLTVLDYPLPPAELHTLLAPHLPAGAELSVTGFAETTLLSARVSAAVLEAALSAVGPRYHRSGLGAHVTVLKGTGHPLSLADRFSLTEARGTQCVAHTRMATESAVTASGSHPFSVAEDLCLVHNGSLSNHASIRRGLSAEGVEFESENDSEVAARFIAWRMQRHGDPLIAALENFREIADGFYTLVVTTATSLAVLRDPIACKPAVIAESPGWVAMASEFRALRGLPDIESARIFEPEPGVVYAWDLPAQNLEPIEAELVRG